VPLVHGTRFYQAVKQNNPEVEWVEYPDEGHGWALPATASISGAGSKIPRQTYRQALKFAL
jgi:acetyl esterase/lipase